MPVSLGAICRCIVAGSPTFCLSVLACKLVSLCSRPLQCRQQWKRQAGKEVEISSRRLLGLRWRTA
jgi:hypothetical protein